MGFIGTPAPLGAVFLTGGTGFLGSHIAVDLLRREREVVILARPGRAGTADQRARAILDWHGVAAAPRRRLRVVSGDLTLPSLGLDREARALLRRVPVEIVHCASDTSFGEDRRDRVEDINLAGLERLLDIAADLRCRRFHLLSTAYVAGKRDGPCLEVPANPEEFHNPYEESKCRAERLAREACRAAGIDLAVYRPSVVYGNSWTGRTFLFNGIYFPIRAAVLLRDAFRRDILERGGRRARAAGVRLDPDEALRLPIRLRAEPGTGIDLLPVDYFVAAFGALMGAARDGDIFHIVAGRPTPLADIVDYAQRLFGLEGIEVLAPSADASDRNPLEARFDSLIEAYGPYMSDRRRFDDARARAILGPRGIACRSFDYATFSRCMTYAVAAGWAPRFLPSAADRPHSPWTPGAERPRDARTLGADRSRDARRPGAGIASERPEDIKPQFPTDGPLGAEVASKRREDIKAQVPTGGPAGGAPPRPSTTR